MPGLDWLARAWREVWCGIGGHDWKWFKVGRVNICECRRCGIRL